MSFPRLSLIPPNSPNGVSELSLSRTPITTPPGEFMPSDSPTPTYAPPNARVRAPRRCSVCRQTGHDARRCPNESAVHYHGEVFSLYANPRDNLTQFVFGRIIQRCHELNDFPLLLQALFEDIDFHVSGLSARELRDSLRNPINSINFAYAQLIHRVNYVSLTLATAAVPLGRDHAKNIALEYSEANTDTSECFICCDKTCSLKTSCGHEYCVDCMMSILDTNKAKTSPATCSFCKTSFTKFTVNSAHSLATLGDFINNL